MKKTGFVIILLVLALGAFSVIAENSTKIHGNLENGKYYLTVILDMEEEGCWQAEETIPNNSILRLSSEKNEAGVYSAVFEPLGDGITTITLRHFNAHTCDQFHMINLMVRDGKIQESGSGSSTTSPDDTDLNPYISGAWTEKGTQFMNLNIDWNKNDGWIAEIISPMTHGAYMLRANIYYDCELDAFVYSDGELFHMNTAGQIQDEPSEKGLTGFLTFSGTEEETELLWQFDNDMELKTVQFVRTSIESNV